MSYELWVMSDELWVMSDEWWVMSNGNWMMEKVKPNRLLLSHVIIHTCTKQTNAMSLRACTVKCESV